MSVGRIADILWGTKGYRRGGPAVRGGRLEGTITFLPNPMWYPGSKFPNMASWVGWSKGPVLPGAG
jgi:hypothetical protein